MARFGFISTRFAGTDGVSLEAKKWATVLRNMGHQCFWLSGENDHPENESREVRECFFSESLNYVLDQEAFRTGKIPTEMSKRVDELVRQIDSFVQDFEIDIIVAQNSLCLPMPLSLGLALAEFLTHTQFPCLAHHHDFYWERERFRALANHERVVSSFPPKLESVKHVVINSAAKRELNKRRGIDSIVVPNVMDFRAHCDPPDARTRKFREHFSVGPDELLVLQPTRIVRRKGIELAIQLMHKLKPFQKRCLMITHDAGDEGLDYLRELTELSEQLDVRLILAGESIGENRSDEMPFSLADAYRNADFVTYPSLYEGFGNALLETIYYRKPFLVNRYSVYSDDIAHLKFRCVEIDGVISDKTAIEVQQILLNPVSTEAFVEQNFQIADRNFGFDTLEKLLGESLEGLL